MTRFTHFLVLGVFLFGTLAAAADDLPARYASERALVETLSQSTAFEDQRQLGELYRDGPIVSAENPLRKPDRDAAITAFRQAIALGDTSAATTVALGRLLLRRTAGSGFAEIVPALQALALEGNGDAAYLLVLDALENRQKPVADVLPELQSAAMLGSPAAVIDLAAAGTQVGETLTVALLARLTDRAETGQVAAAVSLFRIYADGNLVDRDDARAMSWLEQAAELDPVASLELLAEQYQSGLHTPRDPAKAVELYRQAARAGGRNAALALGRSVITDPDMGVSDAEARWWLQKATEAAVPRAAVELSNLDLKLALSFAGDASERLRLVLQALEPIANDPEALSNIATQHWKSVHAKVIGEVLLPLLEKQALAGNTAAAMAYDAWLEANGQAMPDAVARALVQSLRKTPLISVSFSDFTIASLALDGRMSAAVLGREEALHLLFNAADEDVGQAMLRLGQLYRQGDQLARSETFAKRWFVKAAGRAVERASWELAEMQAISRDPDERQQARRFYLAQIELGDPRAGLALVRSELRQGRLQPLTLERAKSVSGIPADTIELASLLFSTGISADIGEAAALLSGLPLERLEPADLVALGRLKSAMAVRPDETAAAFAILEQAAQSGAPVARTALAASYLSSVMHRDKAPLAVTMLQDVLQQNPKDPEARLLLARAYMLGVGIERDARQAAALVSQVRMEKGMRMPKATLLEADWLAFSSSGRDPQKAVALLDAQAARGSFAAQRAVGEYYLNGFGPAIQPDTAASRIFGAAVAGDKEAMAALGHMMLNGYGMNQSRKGGLQWLERAANAGNTAAMYELSRVYALRPEAESDTRQSIAWLQKAAERNHPNAAYQLGLAYLSGDWVKQDTDQAAFWFERSAQSGSLIAARTLQAVRAGGSTSEAVKVSNTAD